MGLRRRTWRLQPMTSKPLGNSDLNITAIGLGTWAIGGAGTFGWGPQDDAQSIAAIRRGVETILASALRDLGSARRRRQLHRSDQSGLLRHERPGDGDGLREAAPEAAVLRAHGRVPERLHRQRDGQRQSTALHRRLRHGGLPPHSRRRPDHGSRSQSRGQRTRRRERGPQRLRPVAARLRRRRGHQDVHAAPAARHASAR